MPQPAYQVRVYSPQGALQFVTDRFRSAVVSHEINLPANLQIAFYARDPIVPYLHAHLDSIIELRRTVPDAGLGWYTEYAGMHRSRQEQITSRDEHIFTSYSRGFLDLIRRRSTRYFGDVKCMSPNPYPADDAIKQYVLMNAGQGATTSNGRATDGVTPGLAVAANLGLAPEWQGNYQGRNLLEVITDIGAPNNVDFDVEWGGPQWPTTFIFRTYYWPGIGTDRRAPGTAPFVFRPDARNMTNPSFTQSRTDEVTSGLLYGNLYDITTKVAAYAADSPYNLSEIDQDTRGEERGTALDTMVTKLLYDKRATINLTFEVLQTPWATYGKHYFLGDFVTARFGNVQADVKVKSVSLDMNPDRETLHIALEEIPLQKPHTPVDIGEL